LFLSIKIIEELDEQDYLSIVLFNTNSEVLRTTASVVNKDQIISLVKKLKTKGSTNLERGLRDGHQLVSKNYRSNYENRVILISDAGLNTGVTDDTSLLKLVSDFARENIGLSAIGLSLNFNQKIIHKISMSKGGNYHFVNSGKMILKLLKNFDFFVSPVTYNLKGYLELKGMDTKLINTY